MVAFYKICCAMHLQQGPALARQWAKVLIYIIIIHKIQLLLTPQNYLFKNEEQGLHVKVKRNHPKGCSVAKPVLVLPAAFVYDYMQTVPRSVNICLPAYVYVRQYCTCGWVWLEVSSFSPLWSKWQGSDTQLSSLTHRAIGNVCWQPLADQPTHLAQIRSYLSKALCTQWKWLPRQSKPI